MAIVGVGIALMTTEGERYLAILPTLFAGLLLFNYWFTVNRLMSAARIVAYIQVVIEGGSGWEGWETSLRKYRVWTKTTPNAEEIVEAELKQASAAIPDALMYYPPIYQLHIVAVALSVVTSAFLVAERPNLINVVATAPLVAIGVIFAWHCWKWTPSKMRSLIERNVIIWSYSLGLKKPGIAGAP